MEMILNKYTVKITDSANVMLYSTEKTGFSDVEVIEFARKSFDSRYIGRHDRIPIYPLTFKAEIWQERS